ALAMALDYQGHPCLIDGVPEVWSARLVPAGSSLTDADVSSPTLDPQQRGVSLLEHGAHFNILCIPPLSRTADVGRATWDAAIAYAARRRAMVIVARGMDGCAHDVRGHRIAGPKPQRRALLSAARGGRSLARQSGRELGALR